MSEKRGETKVKIFAQAMIDKLNEPQNVAKGDWKDYSIDWLIHRLYQEARELENELWLHYTNSPDRRKEILKECADVADFAMFIADKVGALEEER